jgi:hypothetical protein
VDTAKGGESSFFSVNRQKILITVQEPVEHILLKQYFDDLPHGAGIWTL